MLYGLDTNQRVEVSLPEDTTEPKTIFVLKPISGIERVELHGKGMLEVLDAGVIEVKNFGRPELEKRDILRSLSVSAIGVLINKINEMADVTGQDKKN